MSGEFLSARATAWRKVMKRVGLQPGSYGVSGGAASPLSIPVSRLPGTFSVCDVRGPLKISRYPPINRESLRFSANRHVGSNATDGWHAASQAVAFDDCSKARLPILEFAPQFARERIFHCNVSPRKVADMTTEAGASTSARHCFKGFERQQVERMSYRRMVR